MTLPIAETEPESYTIAEAAALTGLHKNTIRLRIKMGHLPADRAMGRFGEEYRISRSALIKTGLLAAPEPPAPTLEPPVSAREPQAPAPAAEAQSEPTVTAPGTPTGPS